MVLKFLGITIDTTVHLWSCRLPSDKLEDLQVTVAAVDWRSKVQLKELQFLLEKQNFACRIMPMGSFFFKALHPFMHLGQDHWDDLQVWDSFLEQYNGRSF